MSDTHTEDIVAASAEGLRGQALERVKKRRDFHTHLFAYVTINVMLWGVWAIIAVTSHGWYPWPLWVTLGWGIGLVLNAWDVYFRHPITEVEIRDEMERLNGASRGSRW